MRRRRSRNGIAPVIAVLALLAGGVPSAVGVPVAVDVGYGDEIGPSNPLYGIETAGESIQVAMTSDHSGKAMMHLDLASERLQEMEQEIESGRPDHIDGLISAYRDNAMASVGEAQVTGKPDLVQVVTDAIYNHAEVLSRIYENAPEEAKFGLETAIQKSDVASILEEALARREGRAPRDIPVIPVLPIGEDEGRGAGAPLIGKEAAEERGAPIDIPAVGGDDRGVDGVDALGAEDRIPDLADQARAQDAARKPEDAAEQREPPQEPAEGAEREQERRP